MVSIDRFFSNERKKARFAQKKMVNWKNNNFTFQWLDLWFSGRGERHSNLICVFFICSKCDRAIVIYEQFSAGFEVCSSTSPCIHQNYVFSVCRKHLIKKKQRTDNFLIHTNNVVRSHCKCTQVINEEAWGRIYT